MDLKLDWIWTFSGDCPKTVAVASEPPFFEPTARRKEHGGTEATATSLDRSFFLEWGQGFLGA